jgi:hypothetical protein
MLYRIELIIVAVFSSVLLGCSDDDSNPTNDISNSSGEVSFSVNGEAKSFEGNALHIITDDETPNSTSVNLDDSGTTLQIIIQASPGDNVTYEASHLEDDNNNTVVSVIYSEGDGTFFNTETSSGEVSITDYKDSELNGSFNFSLENPVSGESITIENGTMSNLTVIDNVE